MTRCSTSIYRVRFDEAVRNQVWGVAARIRGQGCKQYCGSDDGTSKETVG